MNHHGRYIFQVKMDKDGYAIACIVFWQKIFYNKKIRKEKDHCALYMASARMASSFPKWTANLLFGRHENFLIVANDAECV